MSSANRKICGVCPNCRLAIDEDLSHCPVCGNILKTTHLSDAERLWPNFLGERAVPKRQTNEEILTETIEGFGLDRRKFLGMLETLPKGLLREKLGDESWSVRWKSFASFLASNASEAKELLQTALENSESISSDLAMFRRILRYECGTFFTASDNQRFKVADLEGVLAVDANMIKELVMVGVENRLQELAGLYKNDYRHFVSLIKLASTLVKPKNEYPVGYDASMEIGYWIRYNKYGR